ncbi:PhoD-like phosphatase-domain-containing protein [Mycena maculata]|uniref:PhoD-like phosphatase-domain-containing protein n=1 Tax=Mycena maculata TaxID=230809 RepID=A0AAD7N6Y8_9AGAR|nr:PhoD-like phosphatase-domain-containing protein [Mycena maculata]
MYLRVTAFHRSSIPTPSTHLPVLFGTYSRRNPTASFLGLLLNVLAFLACIDFVYRSHVLHRSESLVFSRTGYVDSTSARIVLRDPSAQRLQLTYADATGSETTTLKIPALTETSDYTATLQLTGLRPGTRYFYNTTGAQAGSFLTSAPGAKKFSLISTSCQKPFYPYDPLSHSLGIQGLHHPARYAEEAPPDFVLFLGDFIYSDLPVQVAPLTTQFYRQLYRQVYASPSWTRTLRDIPWIHVFDDHELVNDYFPGMAGGKAMYARAMDPFEHYQRAANPPRPDNDARKTYTQFRRGDASFFVLDTRTYRAPPPAKADGGTGTRTMLGAEQLDELLRWIVAEEGWKVVVSGVPMTRNWSKGADAMDSWAGYLNEREIIFRALWRAGGGVIISGDRHEHATVKFRPPPGYPDSHTIIEFSTSPLSFFYLPFLREYVPHEETVFNLPHGASKFGHLTFDSSDEARWTIGFELVVDGEKAWNYEHVWERV